MALERPLYLVTLFCLLCGICLGRVTPDNDADRPTPGTIDDIIKRASGSEKAFNFNWDEVNHVALTEYDILVPQKEWLMMHSQHRVKRTAGIIATSYEDRWTDNTVKYQLAPQDFSSSDKRVIQEAMLDWEHYTCVRFDSVSAADNVNKVDIKNGQGCYSYVGMIGGSQELGLHPGCRYKNIVLHELGHAMGLHHEQTRPDRDQHVTVHLENVDEDMAYNFDMYTWEYLLDMKIPYDYASIMHYSQHSFSTNGKRTITTADKNFQDSIGNAQDLSFRDVKSMNIMYKCGESCPLSDEDCPGEGFVGKDCKCWCPNSQAGVEGSANYCDKNDRQESGNIGVPDYDSIVISSCEDLRNDCGEFGGLCYLTFIREQCPQMCNQC